MLRWWIEWKRLLAHFELANCFCFPSLVLWVYYDSVGVCQLTGKHLHILSSVLGCVFIFLCVINVHAKQTGQCVSDKLELDCCIPQFQWEIFTRRAEKGERTHQKRGPTFDKSWQIIFLRILSKKKINVCFPCHANSAFLHLEAIHLLDVEKLNCDL